MILGENFAANGALGLDGRVERPDDFSSITAALPRKGEPSVNNLATYRWRGPLLSKAEEAELIRRVQAGDQRAKTDLVQRFHRLVLKEARNYILIQELSWITLNSTNLSPPACGTCW